MPKNVTFALLIYFNLYVPFYILEHREFIDFDISLLIIIKDFY